MNKNNISNLSLREKIAQLIIINGNKFDKRFLEIGVGGIFLDDLKTKKDYKETIEKYQKNSKIKLFVATDMEGYWNPFKTFYESKEFGEIDKKEEAYSLGLEHGKILKEIGFNLNFSPVVEIRNNVWPGRSFKGPLKEVKDKIRSYIKGLKEQGILTTAKHYPGGSMIKDPHWLKFKTRICPQDLELFDYAIENNIDIVMIGHPIVYGAINSNRKQSTISKEVVSTLKNKFDGLIITDAITMLGLRFSYLFNFKRIYQDLIRAGNDIILDSSRKSNFTKVLKRINNLEKAVRDGDITEESINKRVEKLLEIKRASI